MGMGFVRVIRIIDRGIGVRALICLMLMHRLMWMRLLMLMRSARCDQIVMFSRQMHD